MPHPNAPLPPAANGAPTASGSSPLAGRDGELAALTRALEQANGGNGHTIFLLGESGIGKTRLAQAVADEATRRGFTVAFGRAYPVDHGVPYAVFADALLPVLREIDSPLLSLLTRGGTPELLQLFPALSTGDASLTARGDPEELRTRLLWNFAQFLGRLAARQPLLLVLDNLQSADRSSIELLHFTARQVAGARLLIVGTINEHDEQRAPALIEARRSLEASGSATTLQPAPLEREAVELLVARRFESEPDAVRAFATRLYEWTRGNPFFIEETLRWLVDSGRLRRRGTTWVGWDVEELALPASARETVRARLAGLGPAARTLAELAAVIGTRVTHDALAAVADLPDDELLGGVDELRRAGVLAEALDGPTIVYDFTHPVLRETLYADAGLARGRLLHERVAEALERFYGSEADRHAGELAFHYRRADARRLDEKAVHYLRAAGADALAKYASREAADYLGAALSLAERADAESDAVTALVPELARARQRMGEYDEALALWDRALARAGGPGERQAASIRRSMGLACFWMGRHADAAAHFELALAAARTCGDATMECRLLLALGSLAQARGAPAEAEPSIRAALAIAESSGSDALLAATHRALLLLFVWTGPAEAAREHGERALSYAERAGQQGLAWSAHWALAMLAGLTGDAPAVAEHLAKARALAESLRSPLLRVWTAEVAIEYAAGTGDWDHAVALAEETVETARALGQRTLLPRVLVWLGLLHFGRGAMEPGKACVDEAWELADAADADRVAVDVHTVVPAHTGRAAYHLAVRELPEAIAVGERGLAVADRSGYVVWAIHRLLPVVAEAALWASDMALAQRIGARLRRDSARLGHRLGLAWADACDALVELLQGDKHAAVEQLREVVERLEAIPFVPDAARVRRQLARALAETGDRDGATRELRRAHEIFAQLGAEPELDATREQLRALGARPPARVAAEGIAGLTGREVEIVRLVAARQSNKDIGAALDISARTVSTHLSNIFGKLGVGSRGELTDLARREGLAEG